MPKKDNDEQMKRLAEMLEAGIQSLFQTEEYKTYLKVMSRFHDYSINNLILIAQQNKNASLVAGYKAWEKNFGRHVKKGEHGIKIVGPMPVQIKRLRDVRDENGNLVMAEDGTTKKEEVTMTIPKFRVVTVFDISQTEGPPLPERPGVQELTASVKKYDSVLQALQEISPVPVQFGTIEGTANGYFDPQNHQIVVRKGMPEAQTVKTLIHEVAHAWLHDPDRLRERGEGRIDQTTREVEAESVAFMVCESMGISTDEYTFPYVAAWSSTVETPELKSSMEVIRDTSGEILNKLTTQVEQIEKEKDISCRKQIEKSIENNYKENHLDTNAVVQEAVDKFGKDRVERVLAVTAHLKSWDSRFTPAVRDWAEEHAKDVNVEDEEIEHWPPYVLSSHPALVDGVIRGYMASYNNKELANEECNQETNRMMDNGSVLTKMHTYQQQIQGHNWYYKPEKKERGERSL